MIEAGISWKEIQRRLNFQTSTIAAALISHSHKDHSGYVKDAMKAGIDCYMSQGTAEAIGLTGHRLKIINAQQQFQVGTWTVLPFLTQHDCPGSMGFLLVNSSNERLLFATDTYYVKYKFVGLNYIMIECNYALDILKANVEADLVPEAHKNRLMQSHFSLEHVKEFLKANDLSKVREIWLLHLSDSNSDAARFKKEIMELTGKPVIVADQ
jgi:phosphoribosyl 1,2-cyclic phosphodiesterase